MESRTFAVSVSGDPGPESPSPARRASGSTLATRERVVAAASKVHARRGYYRATVDEIASEAGFTIGALCSNFAGKEDLFLAIADRKVEELEAEVAAMGDAAAGVSAIRNGRALPRVLVAQRAQPRVGRRTGEAARRNP